MMDDKIVRLWEWFSAHEREIRVSIDNESASERKFIIEQLNNLVLDLGMFYWEIGPGAHKSWYFTISPNGKRELLELSKTIMESAPRLVDWEYHFCKPPKIWNRRFMLHDDNMIERQFDASGWMFVANQHADGTIGLILEARNIAHLDNYTSKAAAELVVLNEVGEEFKIMNIRSIEIVYQLESHNSRKAGIDVLKKQVESLARKGKDLPGR